LAGAPLPGGFLLAGGNDRLDHLGARATSIVGRRGAHWSRLVPLEAGMLTPNHPLRRPQTLLALTLAGGLAALAACGGGDGTVAPTSPPVTAPAPTTAAPTTTIRMTTTTAPTATTAPTTVATTVPPTTVPAVPRQPLTGQPLADASEIIDRPALVVKIDNASAARRNHSGLGVADLVFEEMVEGRITRFAAVFHSRDSDPVGPVRSGRSQDVDLLTALRNPLFAWSGGNPGVTRLIAASTFIDLNWQHTPRTYYRGAGSTPHNLYTSTQRLWEHIPFGHPGAPPPQFSYLDADGTFTGDPVAGADLRIGSINVSWDWDAEAHAFMRSMGGSPHIDVSHGPIGATNVVLMVLEYKPSVIDTRSPEAQTIGNGPVYIFSDGKAVEGRWFRTAADQPIRLVTEANVPIPINPGTTWVELLEAIPSGDVARPAADFTVRYS